MIMIEDWHAAIGHLLYIRSPSKLEDGRHGDIRLVLSSFCLFRAIR